jgi:hypothetical protein
VWDEVHVVRENRSLITVMIRVTNGESRVCDQQQFQSGCHPRDAICTASPCAIREWIARAISARRIVGSIALNA